MKARLLSDKIAIQPLPVERDAFGLWAHPDLPDFGENPAAWARWVKNQGLKITSASLEDEDIEHPVYIAYFEQGNPDFSDWTPAPPAGNWFTLLIEETDDGPVWVWGGREP